MFRRVDGFKIITTAKVLTVSILNDRGYNVFVEMALYLAIRRNAFFSTISHSFSFPLPRNRVLRIQIWVDILKYKLRKKQCSSVSVQKLIRLKEKQKKEGRNFFTYCFISCHRLAHNALQVSALLRFLYLISFDCTIDLLFDIRLTFYFQ